MAHAASTPESAAERYFGMEVAAAYHGGGHAMAGGAGPGIAHQQQHRPHPQMLAHTFSAPVKSEHHGLIFSTPTSSINANNNTTTGPGHALIPTDMGQGRTTFRLPIDKARIAPLCPKKPRHRRKNAELDRQYMCEFPECGRRYELAHSLNQHTKRKHPGV